MRFVGTLAALAALSLAALPAHATNFTPGEFVTGSQVELGEDPTPTNIAGILEKRTRSITCAAPSEIAALSSNQ